jgi:hypothetical protein
MFAFKRGRTVIAALLVLGGTVRADVKYLGTDRKTLGGWKGVYGTAGAIIFDAGGVNGVNNPGKKNDQMLPGLIKGYDDGGSNRWNWATDAANDDRGLLYVNDKDAKRRIGACAWNTGSATMVFTMNSKEYDVSVYCCDWDSVVRIEDIVGYQGDLPAKADVTVQNPEFNKGEWHRWHVTGSDPFKLTVTHKGGANWVIGGVMFDANLSVDPNHRLTTTWGALKIGR